MPNKFLIAVCMVAFITAPVCVHALVQKTPGHTTKTTRKTNKVKTKTKVKPSKRKTKIPYVLAPKSSALLDTDTPHSHTISPELVNAMATGNLEQAYRQLQLEEASDKVGYLINQVQLAQGKSSTHDQWATDFDRATAFHNLLLFLQSQSKTNSHYVKDAAKYYERTSRQQGYKDKANILLAALYASADDLKKSDSYFKKVNTAELNSYVGLEYLATYYAATHNLDATVATLDQAFAFKPALLLKWIHVGDDFWAFQNNGTFKAHVDNWRAQYKAQVAKATAATTEKIKTHTKTKKAPLKKSTKPSAKTKKR